MILKKPAALILAVLAAAFVALRPKAENDAAEAREKVSAARATLANFLADPNAKWVPKHLHEAKGILIVPVQGKGGLIVAGSGGVGVLLTRDDKGEWSPPAFYRLGSVSVGFQVGGEKSEVLLLIQSQKGVDSFLSSSVTLGAGVSVTAGPVGEGAKAATSDILSYSRSKGAFIGAALEGTVIKPAEDLNRGYYGRPASPVQILVQRSVGAETAEGLRSDLAKIAPR